MTEMPTTFDLRGLIENSLLEWEDRVAAVAIAGGCNLRCPYCHSWRYVTGLADLNRIDPEALFDLLRRQRGWIDGVVFTGGEPTLQPGLGDMIRRAREFEVQIKLHTNGSRPDVIASLLEDGLLDCLALDYKAPLDNRFFAAAGLPEASHEVLAAVRKSYGLAVESGIEREYHTTLAPSSVTPAILKEMAEQLETGGLWIIQQFENGDCLDSTLAGSRRYSGQELDGLEDIARSGHEQVLMKRGKSA